MSDDNKFWAQRPELTAIRQWAQARRVAPWAVLGVILARVITHTPPNVHLPAIVGGLGSLNLFVGLVARSGGGKGAAIAVGAEALEVAPDSLRFARANLGSGEGISAAFVGREKTESGTDIVQHTDCVLFEVAEVDTFGAVANRTGSTLMPEVRKLWSGEALGFQNRDSARTLPVDAHSYRAAMVVGVQPTRAGALLNDADGGTPQRFLWMPATDPEAPDRAPAPPAPISWAPPNEEQLPTIENRRIMRVCDAAWDAIDTAQISRLRGEGDALDGHALFSRLKVAAALALLDRRGEVTEADWSLSATVMDVSNRARQSCRDAMRDAARRENESRAEARAEASVIVADHAEVAALARCKERVLSKVGADWVSAAAVRKSLSPKLREHLDSAVNELVMASAFEVKVDEYQGQQRTQFRLCVPVEVTKRSPLPVTPESPHDHADLRGEEAGVTDSSPLPKNRHLSAVDPEEKSA